MNLIKKKFTLEDYELFDAEDRYVYLVKDQDCNVLLNDFYNLLIKYKKNKEHLSVIRIADGEFQFLLGKDEINFRKPFFLLLKNLLGELYRNILGSKFEARSRTYTSGRYDKSNFYDAKIKYKDCLSYISKNGILAIYTIVKPNFYTEQYIPKLLSFFEENNINIDEKNYFPFYFVYIVLTNKRFQNIYNGANVHLITSYNENRKTKIESSLFSKGVESVSWTLISRDKSLFDKIDVSNIDKNVDIIFIGAGVGKVNIFNQLKNYPCLILDAGYIFEIWQDPNLRLERDYCEKH